MSTNLYRTEHPISRRQREILHGHRSSLIWLTGLSGSGKTTIANALSERFHQYGYCCYILDGDNIRHRLCRDLGFSEEDRSENIRRISEVAWLFVDSGCIVITAFISPLRKDREVARSLFDKGDFIEVYCNADLSVCEKRDTKGLYKRARKGEVPYFTGISSPYEPPIAPEIVADTANLSILACVDQITNYLKTHGALSLSHLPQGQS